MNRKLFLSFTLMICIIANIPLFADTNKNEIQFSKPPISDTELKQKKEGSYWSLLSGPNYTPDLGLILGVLGGFYYNGNRDDILFSHTPYLVAITPMVYWSTKNMYSILIESDSPYFLRTLFRIRSTLCYYRNPVEPYFGSGEKSLEKLQSPNGKTYSNYAEYENDLLLIENGITNAYYNYYRNEFLFFNINIERDILGGLCRVYGGLTSSKEWIHDYTGESVPGKNNLTSDERTNATMQETRLKNNFLAGNITGFEGGWNNNIRLGFAYDSRDIESNPRNGMFHDILFVLSDKNLASDFNYSITTLSTRFYYSPLRKYLDLIACARLNYSIKNGNIPFFVMNYTPTTDRHIGYGGDTPLRGFRLNRFPGPVMLYGNLELRYVFTNFRFLNQFVELMFVPFIDYVRVYDKIENTILNGLKYSYGTSIRVGLNQSFFVSFDFGSCEEEKLVFYLSVKNLF